MSWTLKEVEIELEALHERETENSRLKRVHADWAKFFLAKKAALEAEE